MLFVPIRYINNGEPLDQATLNRHGFDIQENLEEIISRLNASGSNGSVEEIPNTLALRDENGTTQFAAPIVGTNPLRLMDSSVEPIAGTVVMRDGNGAIVGDDESIGTCSIFSHDPGDKWILADGRLLSRTQYPKLFAKVGIKHGNTTASNFRAPDLRPLLTVVDGGAGAFGSWNNGFPRNGVAPSDGIIHVVGHHNSYVAITVGGARTSIMASRSKYGQGPISCTSAIKRGQSYSIIGNRAIRFLAVGMEPPTKINVPVDYYIRVA